MTDSRSTLDDETDDEPVEDSRETCTFWDSPTGRCYKLANGFCADCPEGDETT